MGETCKKSPLKNQTDVWKNTKNVLKHEGLSVFCVKRYGLFWFLTQV